MVVSLSQLQKAVGKKVLVVGDYMVDTYIFGKASRISPEAPVPVVLGEEEKILPGGAGNVALNLISLGLAPVLFGRTGSDSMGKTLKGLLSSSCEDVRGLMAEEGTITTHKMRIVAQGQQMVRLDREVATPLSSEAEKRAFEILPSLLQGVHAIVVSDYGKGFVTRTLFAELGRLAKIQKIPLLVDPKGVDYSRYRGASLIKPNLKEAYEAAGLLRDAPLEEVASRLFTETKMETLLITRSEKGITLFTQTGKGIERQDFPAQAKEVKDVTGAGDTVLSAITLALLAGLPYEQGCLVANAAASLALEHVGCVQVTMHDLVDRLELNYVHQKIYRKERGERLLKQLKGRPSTVLALDWRERLTAALHKRIRENKKQANTLLLHFEKEPEEEGLIEALASFEEVDCLFIGAEFPIL